MKDNFLTIKEAAIFLRISSATLYGWVHRRVIPFRKHGSRLVFSVADLRSWSNSNEVVVIPSDGQKNKTCGKRVTSPRVGHSSLKIEIKKGRSSHIKEM